MKKSPRLVAGLAVLALCSTLAAQDEEKLIKGRVVDADGRPVAGATIATNWNLRGRVEPSSGSGRDPNRKTEGRLYRLDGDRVTPVNAPAWEFGRGVTTDAAGRFEGLFPIRSEVVALMTYSSDHRMAACLALDPKRTLDQVTIILQPAVRVRAKFSCNQLGRDAVVPIDYLYLRSEPIRSMLGNCVSRQGTMDVLLPPGAFELKLYGADLDRIYEPFDVPSGGTDLDLGTVDISASFFALYRGKPLPEWNVTAARGVPLDQASIASFRGKWLLVEFWGFW